MSQSIVFIDSGLADYQTLLAGLPQDAEVHLLDANRDGLAQIAETLQGRSGIDALHILSHGSPGSLQLGSATLSNATIDSASATLASIGSALTPNGDILLYGCNVAQGDVGQAFVQALSAATGADVAASEDLTGAAAKGGDWVLETQTGLITAETYVVTDYSGLFATASTNVSGSQQTVSFYLMTTAGSGVGANYLISYMLDGGSGYNADYGTSPDQIEQFFVNGTNLLQNNMMNQVAAPFNNNGPEDQWSLADETAENLGISRTKIGAQIVGLWNTPGTYTYHYNLTTNEAGLSPSQGVVSFTLEVINPNTAPTAGSGSATFAEGASGTVTLTTLNTTASDSGGTIASFSPATIDYNIASNPALKGSQSVSTTPYTVTDNGGATSASSGTFTIYGTYADDPTSWSTPPSNQTWNTSGAKSYTWNSGASDPDDTVNYYFDSVTGGTPAWMTIGNNTAVSGNPGAQYAGQVSTINVHATGSSTINKSFTVTLGTAAELNDAPTTANFGKSINEDAGYTFAAADFPFADADSGNLYNTRTDIKIISLPSNATLKLSGTDVALNDVIAVANIPNLVITPTADYNGSSSFQYQVGDGLVYSTTSTMTLTVNPVNDAPVLVTGVPQLTTHTENENTNAGNLVSDLLAGTAGGGTSGDKTGRTDVDNVTNGAGEGTAQGIAVYATNNNQTAGNGAWQYSTNNGGSWTDIGAVADNSALLLRATDKVRFVPDTENGTTATLSYYAWDQATGVQGTKVDASTRGGSTTFSNAGDTATITISDVNDTPTLDLDASGAGTGYVTTYLMRGSAVAIADTDIAISDVDKVDDTHPDTIASATVAITAGAIDNQFGTIYEILTAGAGTSVAGSLGTITVTGNGTDSISISGEGTWAEYLNIIKSITYENTNPNAFHGDRTVTVTVQDSGITTAADDKLTSLSASTTIHDIWAPVVDTNGAAAGVTTTVTFTEGAGAALGTAVKITSADASITDEDSHLASVVISIANIQDAGAETLAITGGNNANWSGLGINVSGSGTGTITMTGNIAPSSYQLAMRSISYVNSSQNPSVTQRDITIVATDVDGHVGTTGHSYVNVVPKNDAPVSAGDTAATLNEGALYTLTTGDLSATDVDDAAATLDYIISTAPTKGTLFRDANGNDIADSGETLSATAGAGVITSVSQGDIDAGLVKYQHDGSETTSDSFVFKVEDGLEDGVVAPTGTMAFTVTPVNDLPVGVPTITGTLAQGQQLTAVTTGISDAEGVGAFSYQWKANGVSIGGATASTYTLTGTESGKVITVAVSYTDGGGTAESVTSAATAAVAHVNTAPAGLPVIAGTVAQHQTLTANTGGISDADGLGAFSYQWQADGTNIAGATASTYTLTSTEIGKAMAVVVSYTDDGGTVESLTSVATGNVADINDAPWLLAGGTNPAVIDGTAALFSGVTVGTVESGHDIIEIKFTTSGLVDGNYEKIVIDGEDVVLADSTSGTTTTGSIGWAVAIVAGTATITLAHAGLTPAEASSLIEGLAYKNDAAAPTGGLRVVTLTSIKDSGGNAGDSEDTTALGISSTVDVGDTIGVDPSNNTVPTVTGDNAATVLEGGTITIASADMAATDTEQPAAGLIVTVDTAPANGTLFRDLDNNGAVDGGETLGAGGSFTLADVSANRIKYHHDGGETDADSFTYTVGDGLLTTNPAEIFNLSVTAVNDAPTLTATAANPTFTEGGAATVLFTGSATSTVDAGQNIAELKLQVSGLANDADEKLTVDGTTFALTNGTSGNTAASTVGYAVSVSGNTATVTLTKDDSAANWQTLINGLAYSNSNDNASGTRTVTLTQLRDAGGTANGGSDTALLNLASIVTVSGANDTPTLIPADFTVLEGGSFTLTTTQLAASDADSATSSFTYTLTTAPTSGTLYIDDNGNAQIDSGEALAANGTFTHAQLTGGKVRYQHDGNETGDSLAVTVGDGTASSAAQTVNVTRTAVNDAPAIGNLNGNVLGYPANSGAKLVDVGSDAVVTDPDSVDFNSGTLRVAISLNNDAAHDILRIKNIGTGAGQIAVSGSNVSYGGTTIGSFAGGSGANDLVVTLNGNATPSAVSALLHAIQFSNDQEAPANASRNITFSLSDGDGGLSQTSTVNVTIAANSPPSILNSTGFYIAENTTMVTVISATDPNSRPITYSVSGGADQALFAIDATTGQLRFAAAPDYETPADAGSNNIYNLTVRATNDYAAYVESALTVNVVDVVNEAAQGVAGDTSGPVFGYATVNGTTLTMQYSDASNLDATNIPATGAFTVSGNNVNNVAVNAANKTVTLTLGTAVAYGQNVTVAYTDPTGGNDLNAIQDAAGNDAANLAATAVTNLAAAPPAPPAAGGGGGSTGGSTTTTTGTTTTNPDGTTTVTSPGSGGTITTTGTGITYVNDPNGDLIVDNDGTGTVDVLGLNNESTLFTTGSGGTNVSDPDGNLTVDNDGTGTVTVSGLKNGSTLFATGTGDTTIANLTGTAILNNTGTGVVTVNGITGTTTLHTNGSGPQQVDLTGMRPGDILTIDNTGSGTVELSNLPDGVIVKLLGTGPVVLNDNDGALAAIENAVPSLTSGVIGDGNGDGTPDALQSNVASVSFLNTPTPVSNPANASPLFVTLIVDSKAGVIDTSNLLIASLENIQQLDTPHNLPDILNTPIGQLAFNSTINLAGAATAFSLFVDSSVSVNGYWIQNTEGYWQNLATNIVNVGGKTRIDFSITDGGAFDSDGLTNGQIAATGAVGTMPLSIIGTVQTVSSGGFWF